MKTTKTAEKRAIVKADFGIRIVELHTLQWHLKFNVT